MREIRKKLNGEVVTTFFLKTFGNIHKFWSLSLGICDEVSASNFKSPVSDFFYEASISKF